MLLRKALIALLVLIVVLIDLVQIAPIFLIKGNNCTICWGLSKKCNEYLLLFIPNNHGMLVSRGGIEVDTIL